MVTVVPLSVRLNPIQQYHLPELLDLLDEHSERRTEDGKAGVVHSGHLSARKLQTGIGPVTVKVPKVRAKTGEPVTFRSALVPPYARKAKSLEAALPWGLEVRDPGYPIRHLVQKLKNLPAANLLPLQ